MAERIIEFKPYRDIAKFLAKLIPLHPNWVSLLGLVTHFLVCWQLLVYHFKFAGFLVLLCLILDKTDGEVARRLMKSSKYGELLDEFVGFIGLAFVFAAIGLVYKVHFILWFLALFGVLMLPYSAVVTQNIYREDTGKIVEPLRKKSWILRLANFNQDTQYTVIAICIAFELIYPLLWIFAVSNLYWMARLVVYYGKN